MKKISNIKAADSKVCYRQTYAFWSLHFICVNDYYFEHRRESFSPQDVDSQLYLFSPKYFNVPRKKYSTFRSDDVYIRVPTSASSMRPTHFVAPNITRYSIACLRFYGVNRPLARPVTPRINSPWQSAGPPGNTRPRKSRNSRRRKSLSTKASEKKKSGINFPRIIWSFPRLCGGEQLSQSNCYLNVYTVYILIKK